MHSMPSSKMHPDGDYLACQSLDNSIKIYSTKDRFREKRNKSFMGHQNAGFACEIAFSPDNGKYMAEWGRRRTPILLGLQDRAESENI